MTWLSDMWAKVQPWLVAKTLPNWVAAVAVLVAVVMII